MEEPKIIKYFAYDHLPYALQIVSKQFHDVAIAMVSRLPENEERDITLRKLLEAKDAAVRAMID